MPATVDEKGHALVTCDCGKPITVTSIYGMFCEDMCGLKEAEEAEENIMNMFLNKFLDD